MSRKNHWIKGVACLGVATAAVMGVGSYAHASAIISLSGNAYPGVAGDIFLGVHDQGHLNEPTLGIGLYRNPEGDATSPGCDCEGWGVSATVGGGGVSGYANVSTDSGVNNLSLDSFASSPTTATSSVHLTSTPGLSVTQMYKPSVNAPMNLFEDVVTITNNTGGTIDDVRYVRVMDWDIPPSTFDEFVTIQGVATTTLLERSHNNGFRTANPLAADGGPGFGSLSSGDAVTVNADFVDFFRPGSGDHGAYFRFNFGSLDDGESVTFSVFYGAGANETEALAAIAAESIELFSLGQSDTDGLNNDIPRAANNDEATFIFGFKGVGGTPVIPQNPVPEPVSATLSLMGMGALATQLRRRRA